MDTQTSRPGEQEISFTAAIRAQLKGASFDAKRRPGTETGVEAWYPYYAGYTEEFARAVIEAAALRSKSCVLDPWNGCGTTTRVADALGHTAIGVDINPVAALVASAKLARAKDAMFVAGLAGRLASRSLLDMRKIATDDPLRRWLCPALCRAYRSIEQGILADLAVCDGSTLNPAEQALPPLASFLIVSLQRAARQFAGIKTSTNPTWLRPKMHPPKQDPGALATAWLALVRSMAADLEAAEEGVNRTGSQIHLGDARKLPFSDNAIDLVVTSPPYCTRIDYVVNTSFELAALGIGNGQAAFDHLRRDSMGTPLTRRGADITLDSFPDGVARLLGAIQQHPSKASSSYYFKTYVQYFRDSMASLRELVRVLKPGGAAAFVVQSSYYKDLYVDLPELYVAMGQSLSMKASIVATYDVNRFLAQINSRSSAHRKSTSHREAVVVLEAA